MSVIQIKEIDKNSFRLPDGSIAYDMNRALIEFKKIKPKKYTVSDLILFVFYAQEEKSIRGRTLLFKEIFYFEQEFFKKDVENCVFVPYYYGPYSFHVANKIHRLITSGLVERIGKSAGKKIPEYRLTSKGKQFIKNKYNRLPFRMRDEMEIKRKGLDQHGSKILKAIYQREKFKKYILKSKVSHRYKLISWGKTI